MLLSDVNTTLGSLLGSSYRERLQPVRPRVQVYVQAEPEFRRDPKQLGLFFVREPGGRHGPARHPGHRLGPSAGPEFTNRFNLFRTAELTRRSGGGLLVRAGAGGARADRARSAAARHDPRLGRHVVSGTSRRRAWPWCSRLAIFLVFLILAAQYESWGLPFSVLLGTPFAAFGAYLGLWLARPTSRPSYVNNVFAQIGLIMLIGLAAKNAILIVEFAKMEHDAGQAARSTPR